MEQDVHSRGARRPPIARLAWATFLLLIFSLPFAQHDIKLDGLPITSTDVLFLVAVGLAALGLLRAELKPRWDTFFLVLILYFLTMLPSLDAGQLRSWLKLSSQLYLLSLPVLAFILIEDENDVRDAARVWLGATAICCVVGTTTVILFWLGVDRGALGYGLHPYGTLPPGPYPRIDATFDFPAMLCNYLTVSLVLLLVARERDWVARPVFLVLLALILGTAIFSLTPGLGGIVIALAIWAYLLLRRSSARQARLILLGGVLTAVAFLVSAMVTPIITTTPPPFVFRLPWGIELAPAVRMLTWIEAAPRFVANPVFGAGITANAAEVYYADPSGIPHVLTDAHNVFLNIAIQFGIVGLIALTLLIAAVAKRARALRFAGTALIPLGLAIAWLDAFVYQGLTGSYEDARHLWVLLGLFLASYRISVTSPRSP